MSEKTIWPEWNKKSDRLPGVLDYNREGNIFVYLHKAWVSKYNIADIEESFITHWAKAPDGARDKYSNDNIATPAECEARKKEQKPLPENIYDYKEVHNDFAKKVSAQMKKDGTATIETEVFNDDGGILIPRELCDNPWIPGNEPENSGWYEITFIGGHILIDDYDGACWANFRTDKIIAYKPFKFSEPYVPPEPERELLCPFCQKESVDVLPGLPRRFGCSICSFVLPYKGTLEQAKEYFYKIYDKINK